MRLINIIFCLHFYDVKQKGMHIAQGYQTLKTTGLRLICPTGFLLGYRNVTVEITSLYFSS